MTSPFGYPGKPLPKTKIGGGYKVGGFQQFTPEQMQLFQSLFQHAGPQSFLSKLAGGDQSTFEQVEQPAIRQFGQLQGSLASRFAGMGTGGIRSSGFRNTMNQASQDFASQLQSQRQGLQSQALRDLMDISSSLLGQKPYEQTIIPKQQKQSFWSQLLGGVGSFFGR
jgi:hypothetical protein